MSISRDELDRINEERRKKHQAPLTAQQAQDALRYHSISTAERSKDLPPSDSSPADFLMGLSGVPWPTMMGMLGYSIHASSLSTNDSSSNYKIDDSSSANSGGYSSSDSYSSSSSSSDSGSSSSSSSSD